MSDPNTAADSGQDLQGSYDKGPVSIIWKVTGEHDASVHVELQMDTQRVASNTLSPGDTDWNTGRHEGSDGWCEAAFTFQVPTRGQEGQLELVKLTWVQGQGGDENTTTNQLLATWPYGA